MKKTFLIISGLIVLLFTLGSCKKTNQQAATDKQIIEKYVADHHLNGSFTSSGLYYVILAPGGTSHPTINSTVTVNYKGSFLNGTIFDSANNVTFSLSRVIKGWQEGMELIGSGGKIILIIPSGLAYGASGTNGIPPNTVLRFDVTLVSFK